MDLSIAYSPPGRIAALQGDGESGPYSASPILRLKQHTSSETLHSTPGHSSSVSQLGYSYLAMRQSSPSLHVGFLKDGPGRAILIMVVL